VSAVEPEVSVIVPTRDRPRALAGCLASLERQHGPSFEIVVVDDASVDAAAVCAVADDAPRARLVRGRGRGPAAARNLGADAARASILCFTDDDCRPGPDWLDALVARVRQGAFVVAGPTRSEHGNDPYAAAAQTITNHLVEASADADGGRVTFAPTSNIGCRAEVPRSLPFDGDYPLAAGEDREWCARVAEFGIEIAFEPAAWVMHAPDLSLRKFWRQQERYGRGAYRFHRRRGHRSRLQPLAFYSQLLRKGFAQGFRVGALVVLAQVATAVGFGREALAGRRQ
jgi:glycosyltransferase involved in cell wall biosynthesis